MEAAAVGRAITIEWQHTFDVGAKVEVILGIKHIKVPTIDLLAHI